jgi:F0F1-type ATP synthase assembly protein I
MLNRRGTKAGLSSSYLVSSLVAGAVFLSLIAIALGSYFGASYLFLLNFIILGAMLGVYSFFVSWIGSFFSTFGDYLG